MSKDLVHDALHDSTALYGILLGYGKDNALCFERLHKRKMYFLKEPVPCWQEASFAFSVRMPNFMVFNEDEARKLRDEYQKTRKEILKIIARDNFLETVINKLTE